MEAQKEQPSVMVTRPIRLNGVARLGVEEAGYVRDQTGEVQAQAAAVNDAVRRVESQAKTAMSDMTGGMNFPPGFKMPF